MNKAALEEHTNTKRYVHRSPRLAPTKTSPSTAPVTECRRIPPLSAGQSVSKVRFTSRSPQLPANAYRISSCRATVREPQLHPFSASNLKQRVQLSEQLNRIFRHHLQQLIQGIRSMAAFEAALAEIHSVHQRRVCSRTALNETIHPHEPVGPVLHRHSLESTLEARVQDSHRSFRGQ